MTVILIQFRDLLIKRSIINIDKLYVFLVKGTHACIDIFPYTYWYNFPIIDVGILENISTVFNAFVVEEHINP